MSRLAANLLLLLTGAIWGMGFVAQSTAMEHVGPWAYTASRFALAALALLPFALRERRRAAGGPPLSPPVLLGFAAVGVAIFFASLLQQVGMVSTSVTNAGFLTGLYVVLTPFLSMLVLRAAPHWVVWPAALAAFLGIALLGGDPAALTAGDFLVIAGAVFWAVQIVLVGVFVKRSGRPLALSAMQFAVAAVLATLGAVVIEGFDAASLRAAWPEIVYGGLFSIGLAFTLQTFGQRYTTPAEAAIFLSSEALFAALFGAIFMGDRIPPIGFVGCALIFAAMLAVELVPLLRPSRSGRPRSA